MNSRQTISSSRFSGGQRADEPPEPPPHPGEPNLFARVRSWLGGRVSLAKVQSWLLEQDLLARARSWSGETGLPATAWSSLTMPAPLAFARYLIAFFIGVVVTVAWQSGATKEETLASASTPATLDSMRKSIDRLAAEVARIRSVEQDILDRISAPPPQPVAAPARNSSQRSSPAR